MESTASPDRLQGQLIAMSVLLEAILQALPAQTVKAIAAQYEQWAPQTADQLLNTPGSEAMLQAYNAHTQATNEQLRRIQRQAIFRDSAQGKL